MRWFLRSVWVLALGLIPGEAGVSYGQTSMLVEGKEVKPQEPKPLVLSPMPAPVPALRYRLLPLSSELNPGDAAAVYLRLRHERTPEAIKAIRDNTLAWTEKPVAEFPRAEARAFLDQWGLALEQLRFGAFRRTCDWGYTLPEQRENAIAILLPDAQELRAVWSRLLVLKLKADIAESRFDEAARTAEVGLAFARHLGDAPFLINGLIGTAVATNVLDRLDEFVAQPGAPNLYWSLSALPTPLVPMRGALDQEQKIVENMVPEIVEPTRSQTDAEWSAQLARLHGRLEGLKRSLREYETGNADKLADSSLEQFRASVLALATDKRRAEAAGLTAAMSEDQRLCRFVGFHYRELRDDYFKAIYLPYTETAGLMMDIQARHKADEGGPLGVVAMVMPQIVAACQAETRLTRRVAALRVIEAVRLHAAGNGGKLPETLDAIKAVPIPVDPGTGQPFRFRREGDTALLSGTPLVGTGATAILYRLSIRP